MADKNLMLTLAAIFIFALLIRASYNIPIVGLNTPSALHVGADDGDHERLA